MHKFWLGIAWLDLLVQIWTIDPKLNDLIFKITDLMSALLWVCYKAIKLNKLD